MKHEIYMSKRQNRNGCKSVNITYTSLYRRIPSTKPGIVRRKQKPTPSSISKETASNCSGLLQFIFMTVSLRSGAEPMPKNMICFTSLKGVFGLGSIRNV